MNRTSNNTAPRTLRLIFVAAQLVLPLAISSLAQAQDVVIAGLLSPAKLIVTLLGGFPFIADLSQVWQVDPETGVTATLIAGLASAIDVIHLSCDSGPAGFLTFEYSLAHLAGGPGRLQFFDEAINPVAVLSSSLVTPSSMILERRTGSIIVAELSSNRLISFVLP
jgi:hypothetical protein